MLRNLTITKKGMIVVAAPLLLVVALLATLWSIGTSLEQALAQLLRSQQVLSRLETATAELVAIQSENLQRALIGHSQSRFELTTRRDTVRAAMQNLQEVTSDDERRSDVVANFVSRAEELLRELAETFAMLQEGRIPEGAVRAAADNRKLQSVLDLSDELRLEELRLAFERVERTNRLGRDQRWALLVGGALTLLLTGLFGSWAMTSMVRRMLVVRENVRRLTTDSELARPTGGRDEIAQIDRSVHDMVRLLRAQRSDNEMFVYSVSHDLRSPLVNLQGFSRELATAAAELRKLLDDPSLPADVRERGLELLEHDIDVALHYIDQAVQRQSRIIDSLLRLSRVGRVEYAWQRVDLGPLVRGIVASLRNQEALADVEFVVGDLPTVYGDPEALERVFDNLIGNAVKYRSPERPLRIEVGARPDSPGTARIFVRDNGIGLASQHLERAFLPFSRFAGGPGEGIGLSLVRRVVHRHHGRIWMESEVDVGTTVYVTLQMAVAGSETG